MVTVDALAIMVGQRFGALRPARAIRLGVSVTLVFFGVTLPVEGAPI